MTRPIGRPKEDNPRPCRVLEDDGEQLTLISSIPALQGRYPPVVVLKKASLEVTPEIAKLLLEANKMALKNMGREIREIEELKAMGEADIKKLFLKNTEVL